MRPFLTCLVALAVTTYQLGATSAKPTPSYNQGINIIPLPKSLKEVGGSPFVLTAKTPLIAEGDSAITISRFFADKLNASTGYSLKVTSGSKNTSRGIFARIDPKLALGEEGYTLTSSPRGVELVGKTARALFYAYQSLLQLLPAEVESTSKVLGLAWQVPAVQIQDEPAFEYRGVMVDVCRHFLTVEEMKKHIDIISLFKINKLHWHLTEDQGWRVEIKRYPRLTEIGSKRMEGDGQIYGGFYTQEQIKEIVKYAADRFVTIIPEIEMPGHGMGAITAYPWLTCFPDAREYKVRNLWGVEDDVFCAGKESTFEFIENVLEEVIPLFPSEYVHIGGDECPKDRWKVCPNCQKRIKEEGLKDEHELQSYVIRRAEKMLAKHGKKLIGWDEILEGGLAPSATVMSWRGEDGGIQSANMGHDVIMTPGSGGLYVNRLQGDHRAEPLAVRGYAYLQDTYSYNPIPEAIDPAKRHHIKGAQACLWSEYLYSTELMQYHAYPSEIALAEGVWTAQGQKNFKDFTRRLDNAYVRLDQHRVNYHIPLPEQPLPKMELDARPEKRTASLNFVAFTDSTTLALTSSRPIRIVYTTDGSEPTAQSSTYTQPLPIYTDRVVKVASVLPSGKVSRVRSIIFQKQELAPAVLLVEQKPGLRTRTAIGDFRRASDLVEVVAWTEGRVSKMEELRPDDLRNDFSEFQRKAVWGEGYVHIPTDGVYVFSTNLDQMWLDGQLLIDNSGEVPKYSPHDTSKALKAGWHAVRFLFIGREQGGFPSYWDGGQVRFRAIKDSSFRPITADMLAH